MRQGLPNRPEALGSGGRGVAAGGDGRRHAAGPSQRTRGVTFVLTLVLLGDLVALAAYQVTSWWFVPMAMVAVVVAFGWVREGAVAGRSMVRAGGSRTPAPRPATGAYGDEGRTRRGRVDGHADRAHTGRSRPVAQGSGQTLAEGLGSAELLPEPAPQTPAGMLEEAIGPASGDSSDMPFDGDQFDSVVVAVPPSEPLLDEDDMPLTWDPRPVPRPTYTMKAAAQKPLPVPAGVVAEPVEEQEHLPASRVAGA